jgi:heat shock protein HslJ
LYFQKFKITIDVNEGSFKVNIGCNSIYGKVKIDDVLISFENIIMTKDLAKIWNKEVFLLKNWLM